MVINAIFHFSLYLFSVVICSGFLIPATQRVSSKALFYGPDNQDEDIQNDLDISFPEESITDDWRLFRAKLVAQEQSQRASSSSQIDPFDSLFMVHNEDSTSASPETPQLTKDRWAHQIDHL